MNRKLTQAVPVLAIVSVLAVSLTGCGSSRPKPSAPAITVPRLYGICTIGGRDFGDSAQTDWSVTVSNPGSVPEYAGFWTAVFYAESQELNTSTVTIATLIMPRQNMTFPQDPFYTDGATSCTLVSDGGD